MDIEKIALEVAREMPTCGAGSAIPENYIKDFARRLLAKLVERVDPVAWIDTVTKEVTIKSEMGPYFSSMCGTHIEELYSATAIIAAEKKISELQAWKDAVEDALVINCILDKSHSDPRCNEVARRDPEVFDWVMNAIAKTQKDLGGK